MLNVVHLIGNLGRDPELKYTPSGSPVCNFSIATEKSWKDKNTGERVKKTTWHNLVLWRALAETAAQYLTKGDRIYVQGEIQVREYQDKEGVQRRAFEIVVDEMKMMGKSEGNGNGNGHAQDRPAEPGDQPPTTAQPQEAQPAPTGGGYTGPPIGGDDDDLPF